MGCRAAAQRRKDVGMSLHNSWRMGLPLLVPLLLGSAGTVSAQTARAAAAAVAVRLKPGVRVIPPDAPIYARRGLWFGVGMGAGSASLHCRICDGAQGSKGARKECSQGGHF